MTVFLVGCNAAKPNTPDTQPVNDVTMGNVQPSEQAESTSSSLPTNDTAVESTQPEVLIENIVYVELLAKIIPGKTCPQDIGEILLASDHPLPHTVLKSSTIESHFVTDRANHIVLVFDLFDHSNTNISLWHTLPHINDWLEEKEASPDYSSRSENSPLNSFSIADIYRISQQNMTNADPARMEQFADIVPGESTALDICKVIEESKIRIDSIDTSVWGWEIKFPTDNPSNSIIIDIDSDFTVLRVGHTVTDVLGWLSEH
jgi:hypothetical protein